MKLTQKSEQLIHLSDCNGTGAIYSFKPRQLDSNSVVVDSSPVAVT